MHISEKRFKGQTRIHSGPLMSRPGQGILALARTRPGRESKGPESKAVRLGAMDIDCCKMHPHSTRGRSKGPRTVLGANETLLLCQAVYVYRYFKLVTDPDESVRQQSALFALTMGVGKTHIHQAIAVFLRQAHALMSSYRDLDEDDAERNVLHGGQRPACRREVDRRDKMWRLMEDPWSLGNRESTKPFLTAFRWDKLLEVAAQFHGFIPRATLFATTLTLNGAILATGTIGQRGEFVRAVHPMKHDQRGRVRSNHPHKQIGHEFSLIDDTAYPGTPATLFPRAGSFSAEGRTVMCTGIMHP
ncbi:hypothetical protein CPLU01_03022 [Colletotrichum plurivorum]|uniref:Uncharacterized protein n=1 Tax=Colletotrichum plurivorum TaxID=2175906 RepID=A0A8H6KUI4_9PEZI|nr:hypothetical protein CPLU01_03022 [Colletotrichum plurivorum]